VDIEMRKAATLMGVLAVIGIGDKAIAQSEITAHSSMTPHYSQKTLLKNWALCACLARVAKDERDRDDISVSASGYLEFGHQPIEAYDELRELASKFALRAYSGPIKSELNTMKCIDLFHSKELDTLVTRWVKKHP
jgi:hypothetical protein